MEEKKNEEYKEDFSVDQSQFEIEDDNKERPTSELEATEVVPIDEKRETIQFPWAIAIIIGVLMVLIIACFIVIMILGPEDPATSSSDISTNSGVKIYNFLYKILAI